MNTLTKPEPSRETAATERAYVSPSVDITETKDEYFLEADMPGVGKAGLEVLIENNELTIVGRRQPQPSAGELLYHECNPRDFRRSFVLDPIIDTSKITAQIEQGVLKVRLPKAERVKPRKVKVTD